MKGRSNRRAEQTDKNQPEIVKRLRKIPGVTVELDKDDIFIGFAGMNYWYEIKNPSVANKAGVVYRVKIKPHQHWLLEHWTGHYKIVTTFEQIIDDMGIDENGNPRCKNTSL